MGELISCGLISEPRISSAGQDVATIFDETKVELYHRYLLAREYCRGKDVLVIASCKGCETELLAQVAHSLFLVESDLEADAACRRAANGNGRGHAWKINAADASVDVAVSFGALERIGKHDHFLAELRRVLRPDGLLIISTPDRDAYSPVGSLPDPRHVIELTNGEFETLLKRHFSNVTVSAQRALIGSVIMGSGAVGTPFYYERRGDTRIEGSRQFARAPHMFALASDAGLPQLPGSTYVYRSDLGTDARLLREAEAELRALRVLAAENEIYISAQRKDIEALSKTYQARLKTSEETLKILRAEVNELAAQNRNLHSVFSSTAWRITAPLRKFGQRFPGAARTCRRIAKLVWWTLTFQLFGRLRQRRDMRRALASEAAVNAKTEFAPNRAIVPGKIAISTSEQPLVSVIIPTYGQVDMTLQCLDSLAKHPPVCSIEVLVVDDAYPGPEDVGSLTAVKGIHLIRNAENLGFLLSCNAAAQQARGKYIYFLNNDTVVNKDTIDKLVDVFEKIPDAGIVGSKLLFPDGSLQEAGGIIWADASGWNYGRGQDPGRSDFNFLRETDYCSGASVLIPRALFLELGGFEKELAPAYYEDVDLAFRVRERGLKVLYQPLSEVIHFEGISHGTDLTAGVKAHQAINQKWIQKRWENTLLTEHYPSGNNVLRARDRARNRKVILVIDHYTLEPDRDAGSRSTMGIITSLMDAGWDVKFWPSNRRYSPRYAALLEQRGVEVLDSRWPGDLSAWLEQYGADVDHIMINRPDIAENSLPSIMGSTDAVLSYYGHDLHFARMRREARLVNDLATFERSVWMERRERQVWRQFDVVIYPSVEEAEEVERMEPVVQVKSIVPFTFEAAPMPTAIPGGKDVLFVAGFAHPPNVDAALFLIHQVIPKLEARTGPVNVVLAGSHPTEKVKALSSDRVRVTGYVTDEELEELYSRSRVAVVPLRFGAGVKGKVVEALSHGLPLVTTGIGAQGIPGLEEVAEVHDDAEGIAAALEKLLTDDAAWSSQAKTQLDFAKLRFSKAAMRASVLEALAAGEKRKRAS